MNLISRNASFRFGHRWQIDGPIETVFDLVSDARTFPNWLHAFKSVETDDENGRIGIGSHTVCKVRAVLPYDLDWDITVTQYDRPNLVETDCRLTIAGHFHMRGYVRYRFLRSGELILIINEQELTPNVAIPGWVHSIAQAVFSANHHWAMNRARGALQQSVWRESRQVPDVVSARVGR